MHGTAAARHRAPVLIKSTGNSQERHARRRHRATIPSRALRKSPPRPIRPQTARAAHEGPRGLKSAALFMGKGIHGCTIVGRTTRPRGPRGPRPPCRPTGKNPLWPPRPPLRRRLRHHAKGAIKADSSARLKSLCVPGQCVSGTIIAGAAATVCAAGQARGGLRDASGAWYLPKPAPTVSFAFRREALPFWEGTQGFQAVRVSARPSQGRDTINRRLGKPW